jgi:putative membrane protein
MGDIDFPAVNACLNAASGLLVAVGFAAVKGRRIGLHKACMFAALGTSAVFLASYLYYHIVVRHGEPTRFSGPDGVRLLYFAILGSHTILAIVVAPLALYTAYQGMRDNILRHVWIARWTLPLWLYVSVTGVVVYWMLYHLYPPA